MDGDGIADGETSAKGCRSSRVALGLSFGTRLKQRWRKSFPSGDIHSGMGGGDLLDAM